MAESRRRKINKKTIRIRSCAGRMGTFVAAKSEGFVILER